MPRASWPPYRTVRDLIHAHLDRPGVVLGGGPTMASAVVQCPPNAIYLSANDHGLRRFKHHPTLPPREVHYSVACDKIEKRARYDVGRDGDKQPWNVPVISRHMWADYRLMFMPGRSSGMAAAFVLRLMGCSPIILTGMDLYGAGGTYHDDPKAKSSGFCIGVNEHLARWRKVARTWPAMYRVIGCHRFMQEEFGQYMPHERVERPHSREVLEASVGGEWAEITRAREVSFRPFAVGDVYEFDPAEVKEIIRDRAGKRLSSNPKKGKP